MTDFKRSGWYFKRICVYRKEKKELLERLQKDKEEQERKIKEEKERKLKMIQDYEHDPIGIVTLFYQFCYM